jgi:hypothetical protein
MKLELLAYLNHTHPAWTEEMKFDGLVELPLDNKYVHGIALKLAKRPYRITIAQRHDQFETNKYEVGFEMAEALSETYRQVRFVDASLESVHEAMLCYYE